MQEKRILRDTLHFPAGVNLTCGISLLYFQCWTGLTIVPKDGLDSPISAIADRNIADSAAAPLSGHPRWYLILALFLVGINLRPALSSVGPVLAAISSGIGLSSTGAGLLTTLPVVCFGVFAPLAPWLASRLGGERAVLYGLLVLAAALGGRVFFDVAGLFAGTLVAGATIGMIMVLLPGIIKRDFPRQAGAMTGVYTMALCLGAAMSAGLTVPLEQIAGDSWRAALAFWLAPALLAAAVWWPHVGRAEAQATIPRQRVAGLWSNRLAWQVTAYLGLQSALAYCIFGWLPTILIDRGMTPLAAGGVLSLSISAQLITAFGGPWLATRGRDQRPAIAVMMILSLAGFAGCVYADSGMTWLWGIVLGLGQGGAFSIALMLLVLRAPNAAVASSLSGMAQGVGYTGAALGPLAFGLLHDASHDWNSAAVLFMVIGTAALVAGLAAGRNRLVQAVATEAR
jgi:CP family cyanate transporter-like MFS transporter